MKKIAAAALLAMFGMGFASHAHAAPTIAGVTFSEEADGDSVGTFEADAKKIFVYGDLTDVAPGATIRSEWIAVKVKGATAEYRVDVKEKSVLPTMHTVRFGLNKPNAGWPVGDYRVDLYVDGKLTSHASFKVEEPKSQFAAR